MFKIKNINAGLIILKKINTDYYALIGSNIIDSKKVYKFSGGKYISLDKTALHTAVRQFIEQIFNIKISSTKIDEIVKGIIKNKLLLNEYVYVPNIIMTYFGSFKVLNYIYKEIYNQKLNIYNFFSSRNKNMDYISNTSSKLSKISLSRIKDLLTTHTKFKRVTKLILFKIKIIFNIK